MRFQGSWTVWPSNHKPAEPWRQALARLGLSIALARKRRWVTQETMAAGAGVKPGTYRRVERGDPRVAMEVYARILGELGGAGALGRLLDPRRDERSLRMEADHQPIRIRIQRAPAGQR